MDVILPDMSCPQSCKIDVGDGNFQLFLSQILFGTDVSSTLFSKISEYFFEGLGILYKFAKNSPMAAAMGLLMFIRGNPSNGT